MTQAVLEICGSAYFGGKDWPERVWLGLGSLCGLIAAFPALGYVRIVECYAAGPVAVRGTEELLQDVGPVPGGRLFVRRAATRSASEDRFARDRGSRSSS